MPKTYIEKMEEATGIAAPPAEGAEMPYKPGEAIKPGETARPWTGPRPWRTGGATSGSPPMTAGELKKGYRSLGKGLK